MFCCTTLAQSSPVATLAPFNPDIEFANAHTFFLRGQPPLIVSARLLVARAKRGVSLFVNPPPCRYCSAHSTHTAPLYHGKSLIPLVIPFHPSLITLQALFPNRWISTNRSPLRSAYCSQVCSALRCNPHRLKPLTFHSLNSTHFLTASSTCPNRYP